ncbi:MAG: penicillin-binding transpeptidase domain-containing protein, partial [Rickettsiaceae bacterium]|nr:penicillin-binding transpeptidase domain-containing protein [Rickettsiaceae bacterium]
MNKLIPFFLLILTLNKTSLCAPIFPPEDRDLATILKANNAQGTIVIASLNNDIIFIHNTDRANERLSPASTFKIPNSLIALEEGILANQYQKIQWDGKKRFLDAWNKHQDLKSAFRYSCVWFYQELAKQIGRDKYLNYLKKFNYGNQLLGDDITTFWLGDEGDLKISPLEQIEFLQKIYQQKLPVSKETFSILQDIMLEESNEHYNLYSKSGAATKDWKGHGWYVGY